MWSSNSSPATVRAASGQMSASYSPSDTSTEENPAARSFSGSHRADVSCSRKQQSSSLLLRVITHKQHTHFLIFTGISIEPEKEGPCLTTRPDYGNVTKHCRHAFLPMARVWGHILCHEDVPCQTGVSHRCPLRSLPAHPESPRTPGTPHYAMDRRRRPGTPEKKLPLHQQARGTIPAGPLGSNKTSRPSKYEWLSWSVESRVIFTGHFPDAMGYLMSENQRKKPVLFFRKARGGCPGRQPRMPGPSYSPGSNGHRTTWHQTARN